MQKNKAQPYVSIAIPLFEADGETLTSSDYASDMLEIIGTCSNSGAGLGCRDASGPVSAPNEAVLERWCKFKREQVLRDYSHSVDIEGAGVDWCIIIDNDSYTPDFEDKLYIPDDFESTDLDPIAFEDVEFTAAEVGFDQESVLGRYIMNELIHDQSEELR